MKENEKDRAFGTCEVKKNNYIGFVGKKTHKKEPHRRPMC